MNTRNFFRGIALIEFVLILPLLLVIGIGVIEFSIMFYDKSIITMASREGARYGVAYRTPYATSQEVIDYTENFASNKLISFAEVPEVPVVTAVSTTTPPVFGDTLTVTVTYDYTGLLIFRLIGDEENKVTLTSTTSMTYE